MTFQHCPFRNSAAKEQMTVPRIPVSPNFLSIMAATTFQHCYETHSTLLSERSRGCKRTEAKFRSERRTSHARPQLRGFCTPRWTSLKLRRIVKGLSRELTVLGDPKSPLKTSCIPERVFFHKSLTKLNRECLMKITRIFWVGGC